MAAAAASLLNRAPLLCTTLDMSTVASAIDALRAPSLESDLGAVHEWEQRFSNWIGRPSHAFATGRGSLLAVARALGLGPGDEVIVPAFTCRSVAQALRSAGPTVVFADIEPEGFGLDVASVQKALTARTRALLVQHSFGLVGRDFAALLDLAHERRLLVIEDCAHATGARWRDRPLGSWGDGALFSFERGKMLSTVHGGVAVVRGEAAAERLNSLAARAPLPPESDRLRLLHSVLADHGTHVLGNVAAAGTTPHTQSIPRMWPQEYEGRPCPAYEYRLAPEVARMAQVQFDRLDEVLAVRARQASHWQAWAASQGLRTARVAPQSQPAWLRFPVWVDEATKAAPQDLERELGVEVGLWFTSPEHPVPSPQPHCPVGMAACAQVVNLPTWLPPGHRHAAAAGPDGG